MPDSVPATVTHPTPGGPARELPCKQIPPLLYRGDSDEAQIKKKSVGGDAARGWRKGGRAAGTAERLCKSLPGQEASAASSRGGDCGVLLQHTGSSQEFPA